MAEKKQFNGDVYVEVARNFNKWETDLAGMKGEKIGAALLAIQALYRIDSQLLYRLMEADATVDEAEDIIMRRVGDAEIRRLSKPLSRTKRAQLLKDAKRSGDKASRTR